jgi:hypothetical protein
VEKTSQALGGVIIGEISDIRCASRILRLHDLRLLLTLFLVPDLASQPALHEEDLLPLLVPPVMPLSAEPVFPKEAQRTSRLSYTTVNVLATQCLRRAAGKTVCGRQERRRVLAGVCSTASDRVQLVCE